MPTRFNFYSRPLLPVLAASSLVMSAFTHVVRAQANAETGALTPEEVRAFPTRLSLMKLEEFSRWLVGTEWEFELNGKTERYWFATPYVTVFSHPDDIKSHKAFAYQASGPGVLNWYWYPNKKQGPQKLTVADDLKSAELDNTRVQRPVKLIGRRYLQSVSTQMTVPEFGDWLLTHELRNHNRIRFGADGYLVWNAEKERAQFKAVATGVIATQTSNPWIRSLVVFESDLKQYRWLSWWGNETGKVVEAAGVTAAKTPAASISGSAAIPIKKRLSSVGGLLVVPLGDSRYAGKTSKLSITALKMEKDAPATIGFNQEVGESMGKALTEVSKYHTLRHDGWPRGQKMEIFFEDKYSPKDGPSAAVACALLVESLVTGVDLDPGFCVTGDLNADGSVQPIGGVIAKLRGATKGGLKIAAIPQKNRTSALDLAVGEGATPFVGLQLFSVDTFDEALALARNDRTPALAEAITAFDAVSARIKSSPGLLGTPAIRDELAKVVTAAPNHVSARLLLAMAEARLPGQFSASGSLEAVDQAVAAIREATDTDLSATSSLDSGKLSASRNRLQRLRGMVDTRVQPYVDAWITWASLADQMISRRSAPPQVIEQFKAAGSRINAEAKKLEGNSEFMEEVLR
ncbi:S16 family serine protease [Verrucomicrobium sp. BvORR106]|uniref:S16 family serine protease n=1 Tax=Verrucomicrobium sp. BvORR106 TaxID=1403819 RepID=UPI0009DCC54B|nr:S16 family serine protease [Verrucomicrobium sp. BvORR106]